MVEVVRKFGETDLPVSYDGTRPFRFPTKRTGEVIGAIAVEEGQVVQLQIGHETMEVLVTGAEKTSEGDTRFTFEVIE